MSPLGPLRPGSLRPFGQAPRSNHDGTPPRALIVALVLACASLMLLDRGTESVVDPARSVVGDVVGPAQAGVAGAIRPIVELPGFFRSREQLRAELASLEAENAGLRTEVRSSGYRRNKLLELEGLTSTAESLGYALVPARVVGLGSSQSFTHTVTIDAGSAAGLAPDMTVINNDGLVGRILRVTRTSATVLTLIDSDSTVGGRIGESMELGFLQGRGMIGGSARLDLELLDQKLVPAKGDTVVSWGSLDDDGNASGPYTAGVPIGQVVSVYASLRESTQRAVIDPFVDFTELDLVGVVVASGTRSDRAVVEADGSLR
ncbi:rod shape-determining protein MreC [Nocardioides sp.]|uniref:rod shape-determining protein MreC n=1 Tax=Nocardioides sp. TaxID=35761 RepID=UPI002B27683E|nr:rod shape-determining protein MreC [Nocardioides sp.]